MRERNPASIRIGSGASWMGDRIDPAKLSAEEGALDYLAFETMAELTVSLAQQRRRREPDFLGYDPYLDERMLAVLPGCLRNGTKIISNQGWINPKAAAERVIEILRQEGHSGVRVAAIEGSLIGERALDLADTIMESGEPTSKLAGKMISAEAYLGAEPIVEALREGAQIVLTGRVADPSLFLAPMMYEFGWDPLDHERLGPGQGIGHVMECAGQASGGCFMDPGFKEFSEPWKIGFPIAEVFPDGEAIISKVPEAGGGVTAMTVKEQLFYEVHDPGNYLTPDVVVDFTKARIEEIGPDRVRVSGIRGKPRTDTLKVSISCPEGFIGEDMVFCAGPGALQRAHLVQKILQERFKIIRLQAEEIMFDFPGINAIHGDISPWPEQEPYEVILRVAARCKSRDEALKIGREIDAMAVCGPGMIGKRPPYQDRAREIIGVWSTLVPRDQVPASITFYES